MHIKYALILLLVIIQSCKTNKTAEDESIKSIFYQEQRAFGKPILNYLYNNVYALNSLNEIAFTEKLDSLQSIITTHLTNHKNKLDKKTYTNEQFAIKLFFDKYILEYPLYHEEFTGEEIILSENNLSKLNENLKEFNHANLLSSRDYIVYMEAYIKIEAIKILESFIFSNLDNQQLNANWNVIESTFTNHAVSDFWKQEYLYDHIDNMGIKNIGNLYTNFINSCKTPEYITKISELYESQKKGRESHIIETYKEIDGYELEMHLFLPDAEKFKEERTTMVHFHGGSWSQGKPDWFFETGQEYAKQGLVVAAVEYRIKGKQGTYPFESIKDAKSAIRWLRENATKYNIDPNKIIATGNSAGGHLCLATALIKNWNEETDNLEINAVPDVIIVNSGVYDLTNNQNKWIVENIVNKDLVKEISPNHLIAKSATKMLLIHGEKDMNCSYGSAEYFYNEMKLLDNDIELHTIKGADHWIWLGRHSAEVAKITREYMEKLNLK